MKNEEKNLLLRDLCERLPYGVKFHWRYLDIDDEGQDEEVNAIADVKNIGTDGMIECGYKEVESDFCHISEIKPYLRPMSSMTEEEGLEFYNLCKDFHDYELFPCYLEDNKGNLEKHLLWYTIKMDLFDWLNAHHFDYRGLIPKGLALEAPEDMYNIK